MTRIARLPREAFIRAALSEEIRSMLDELGNPPLVERIFPNGWNTASVEKLGQLYDLCIRTYVARAEA